MRPPVKPGLKAGEQVIWEGMHEDPIDHKLVCQFLIIRWAYNTARLVSWHAGRWGDVWTTPAGLDSIVRAWAAYRTGQGGNSND